MENASKALLIAGAILLCILIIAIGMFIYNSASTTITESMTSLSSQEIETFNNQFIIYQGAQSGSNIKALLGRLIANADTYKNEKRKLPCVYITKVNATEVNGLGTEPNTININRYITKLARMRNGVENNHEYWVEFSFQTNGLIDYIVVSYSGQSRSDAYNRHRERTEW